MRETLKRCGDDLTRANLMKQAASFQKFRVPLLLPGITVSTSPTDFYPDPGGPASALQGRDLGAVRRRHARREQLTCSSGTCVHAGNGPPVLAAFCSQLSLVFKPAFSVVTPFAALSHNEEEGVEDQ